MSLPEYFHHRIVYPEGTVWEGKLDHSKDVKLYELYKIIVKRSVLDIATNDGFWAFWAEMNGADSVVANDVGTYDQYDWGFNGPPEAIKNLKQQNKWEVFDFHHDNLNSDVAKIECSVYELPNFVGFLDGRQFDLIINYGLLYHLRNPQLALDVCREICGGAMILETLINSDVKNRLLPFIYNTNPRFNMLQITDYNLPTESAVVSWLDRADFPVIFVQRQETITNPIRQRFVACVSDEMTKHFRTCEAFFEVDEDYWAEVKQALVNDRGE